MLGKIIIALLLLALVFMTFKFMREREQRLRDRAKRPPSVQDRKQGDGEKKSKTFTLKKDPKTGIYRPDDE